MKGTAPRFDKLIAQLGVRAWSRWTFDGTLVDANGFLPDGVAEAVELVVETGVPVVLSTGRSWHGTRPLFERLHLPSGPTVCSNGAVVVRYPPQEIVKAITFDPRPVITQVKSLRPAH